MMGDKLLMDTFDPCERCDSLDFDILLSVPNIDRFSERFPYFDRGLGCMVTSKNQRLESYPLLLAVSLEVIP